MFAINGRGVTRSIGHMSDRIDGESKTPPGPLARYPRADPESPEMEVGAMRNRSNPTSENRDKIAIEFLKLAARDLATATRDRIRYIGLAREYGLTNATIADALGVSEKSVRGLIERNADIAGGCE